VTIPAPDIFLSYSREDAAVARTYADAFAQEGLHVWWDATLRSGEAYDEVTEEALRSAKAVVVLWSPRSVASRWVRAEATIADRNTTLTPVMIEACERPVMFELTQTADLCHWTGQANDPAWRVFLGDVRRRVGRSVSESVAAEPAAAGDDAGVPRAGVLPFTFRGDDGELEFLAEDLTEDVTRALAENDYFGVIAAGTMEAWRGKADDYRAIGRKLDARYLVEGKLQRAGDAIRLTVQLIDTETANAVWSHRFAGSAQGMAADPEALPTALASELAEHVFQAEFKRAMAKSGPYSGWDHVMRSMAYERRPGADGGRKCMDEARRAVAAAPDFGLAHAACAGAVVSVTCARGIRIDDALRRELHEHIARALQLDGDNPAVLVLVVSAYTVLGDGETCLRLARRAVDLRPTSPRSHFALGSAYLMLGRTTEAIAAFADQLRFKGYDLSRSGAFACKGWCHLVEGDLPAAAQALDQSLALSPNYEATLKLKAIAEAMLGEERTAVATMRRLRDIAPEVPLDQHIFHLTQNPRLGRRSGDLIATLRRLWAATGGDP
jgi:TolB-like protein